MRRASPLTSTSFPSDADDDGDSRDTRGRDLGDETMSPLRAKLRGASRARPDNAKPGTRSGTTAFGEVRRIAPITLPHTSPLRSRDYDPVAASAIAA
jgi:hypothetical protein